MYARSTYSWGSAVGFTPCTFELVGSGPAPSFVAARGRLGQADVDGASTSSSRLAST